MVHFSGQLRDLAGPVSLASAVASATAVIRTFQLPVKIKWPNDLYVAGKKLTGILVESIQIDSQRAGFIIGIGINVAQTLVNFPPELQSAATSIAMMLNREVDESEKVLLGRELMVQLDETFRQIAKGDFSRLRQDWLTLAGGADQPIIVSRSGQIFHARIMDIDYRDNSLLVQDPRGLILQLQQNTCKIIG
jgi:BirA family biotin operon repressor/biotin-[acetyl-CoA-carboxylase] ligase